jgi:hypothetical protein
MDRTTNSGEVLYFRMRDMQYDLCCGVSTSMTS